MKREMKELIMDATKVGDVRSPMVIGVHFDCAESDRGEVVREWARKIREATVAGRAIANLPGYNLLAVTLEACGSHATYRTVDDIPLVDVPCPCGDPNHWLIKYREA